MIITKDGRKIVNAERSSIDDYFDEIKQFKNPSVEEQHDLAARIQAGDTRAEEELIKRYLRLVVSIAKKHVGKGLELDDLISEGNIGLIRAARKYNPAKGSGDSHFSTFATWWIKQSIGRAIEEKSRAIRLPVYAATEMRRVQRAHNQYLGQRGKEPSIQQVAEMTGLSVERILELDVVSGVVSLDKNQMGEEQDGNATLGETIAAEDDTEKEVDQAILGQEVAKAMAGLTNRERQVIILRYGINDGRTRTLEEIGKEFGLTRERIRQIEVSAIKKLRGVKELRLLADTQINPQKGNQFHRSQKAAATKLRIKAQYMTQKRKAASA